MVSQHQHVQANVFLSKTAVVAIATGKNRRDKDPVTDLEVLDIRTYFSHYS
jgi:hypothetical protein